MTGAFTNPSVRFVMVRASIRTSTSGMAGFAAR